MRCFTSWKRDSEESYDYHHHLNNLEKQLIKVPSLQPIIL